MKKMYNFFFVLALTLGPLNAMAMTSFVEVGFVSNSKIKGAPRVRLVFNEMYFISYMLTRPAKPGKPSAALINKFREIAKKKDKVSFESIAEYGFSLSEYVKTDAFAKSYSNYLSQLKALPEYEKLSAETHKYIRASLKEWDSNLEKSFNFMARFSGFKFDYDLNVYITHPSLGNGKAGWSENEKAIQFGAVPTFKNYFTVYIWHEILHLHMANSSVAHAVNQLLTDNDLRLHLNGGSPGKYEGHPQLFDLMKVLESDWKAYKNSPSNLNIFVGSESAKDKVKVAGKAVRF